MTASDARGASHGYSPLGLGRRGASHGLSPLDFEARHTGGAFSTLTRRVNDESFVEIA